MSGQRLGVLAVGFGGIGSQDHQSAMYLPALAAHPGYELLGVTGLTEPTDPAAAEAAEHAATRYGVRHYAVLADALADPGVDVVCLAAPLLQRPDSLAQIVAAGKHVLADKPLAADPDDIARLDREATARGLIVMPAHYQRLQAAVRTAGAAVRSGRIGLPWNIQADFLVAGGEPAPGGAADPDGELANLGIHPVDTVRTLLGLDIERVRALGGETGSNGGGSNGIRRPTVLLLDHEHGVTSTISCGRLPALNGLPAGAPVVHRYRISGSHGVLLADVLAPAATVVTGAQTTRRWNGPEPLTLLVDQFAQAVRTGRPAPGAPRLTDAWQVARAVVAAQRSLRTGESVSLDIDRPAQAGSSAEQEDG